MKNMLTESQINNLKKGDKLLAEVQFHSFSHYGALICSAPLTISKGEVVKANNYYHPSCLSLPPAPPKYDPCRKFKKGDIVRLKEWNGRCPEMYSATNSWINHPPRSKNGNLEVREDEKESMVEIGIIDADCAHATAAPCFLELVTPVEKMGPYSVKETISHDGWQIVRDGLPLAIYDSQRHPNAKAAAEAERDRLNAELN